MWKRTGRLSWSGVLVLCGLLLNLSLSHAQEESEPGHSIGEVSTKGALIVMELVDGALGKTNLFDLTGHTLRFTPDGSRYRVESGALRWEADLGPEVASAEVTLHEFAFPFSGKRWNSFLPGTAGSISFGTRDKEGSPGPRGPSDSGVSIDRFEQLADAASSLIESAPAICVFLKPRMSGPHYVKELPGRVVITWDLTEPYGSLLDFTWFKTINRFQAALYRDGSIEMSYKELAAKDAIVGIYPVLLGEEKPLATITAEVHPLLTPHLDVQRVKLSILDATLLRVTFETRGQVPSEGDRAMEGIGYRVDFDASEPRPGGSGPTAAWIIEGMADPYNPSGGPPEYFVSGSGVFPKARISGNSITIEGVLPAALRAAKQMAVSAEVVTGGDHAQVVERLPPHAVRLSGIRSPEVHLSSMTRKDGPFAVVYESFHYLALPRRQDLSCTVIKALGDKFDFLAYYSDFRIDNQEASSPSFGPAAGNVTGIGQTQHHLESYCTQGRFQWGFAQLCTWARTKCRNGPRRERPSEASTTLPSTSTNSRRVHRRESPFLTTTRCRISGMRWATAGPRMSPRKSMARHFLLALGPTGRRDCRPLFHSPISGPRRHPPLEGASGRTTSTERTRSSMTATSCRQRVIRILTCT